MGAGPVNFARRPSFRLAAAGVLVLALMAGAAFLGARLWRKEVRVPLPVAAPAAAPAASAASDGAEHATADLVEASCPAVVSIEQPDEAATAGGNGATAPDDNGAAPRAAGFLISADGYLVTAANALPERGRVQILLNDGRSFDAARVGQDPLSGLAVLKIDASGMTFLEFAASHFPRVGEQGVMLASPNGTGCLAQPGMISADFLAERAGLWSYIEIRPAPEPDFAGAPFLDRERHVVGIAGLRPRPANANAAAGSRLLPAGTAARIVSELLRNGRPAANRFGIVAEDLLPELAARAGVDRQQGAIVSLIRAGSPAALAGLKAGDIVLSAAGAPISGASELSRALDTDQRLVPLDVSRRSRRITLILDASARSSR